MVGCLALTVIGGRNRLAGAFIGAAGLGILYGGDPQAGTQRVAGLGVV